MSRVSVSALQLAVPCALVAVVGLGAGNASPENQIYWLNAITSVAIVVALYVFVGNSGVLSFGHISFVAVGAFTAGLLTVPLEQKQGALPDVYPLLRDHTVGGWTSLLLAAVAGGVFAFLVGLPLMRLSGLAAGIATFAVLAITHNLLSNWTGIGPGLGTLTGVPETTGPLQATIGAVIVIVVAYGYQRSPLGRLLRASREDAAAARGIGVDVHRQRLWSFTLSGALSGLAGGLYVHFLGFINANDVYLDLTFLTLAMLVVGGMTSLWGAVVGALAVSGLDSFLSKAEDGIRVVGVTIDVPQGTRLIFLGAIMALVLILRPSGITGGREFSLAWLQRRR